MRTSWHVQSCGSMHRCRGTTLPADHCCRCHRWRRGRRAPLVREHECHHHAATRGIIVDLTDPCHQQRLLIFLMSEAHLLLLWCMTLLCPVPFIVVVVARVAVIFAAAPTSATCASSARALLLLLTAWPVLATAAAFVGAQLGAALTGLLVLHPCQPLLLSEQQFATCTHGQIGFFIPSSFDLQQMAGYLLNRHVGSVKHRFN
jgi:hypothetical protein